MTGDDKCPRCGESVMLIDSDDVATDLIDPPSEDERGDPDADVWACADGCGWWEEATPDESLEENLRELEWLAGRLAAIEESKEEGS